MDCRETLIAHCCSQKSFIKDRCRPETQSCPELLTLQCRLSTDEQWRQKFSRSAVASVCVTAFLSLTKVFAIKVSIGGAGAVAL